jgi:hypothetical protein
MLHILYSTQLVYVLYVGALYMYHTCDSCLTNLVKIIEKKVVGQLQSEYFRISTIVSKYARSINKFQSSLVFWARFEFIKFQQIVLSFIFLYIAGPLKN